MLCYSMNLNYLVLLAPFVEMITEIDEKLRTRFESFGKIFIHDVLSVTLDDAYLQDARQM